MATVVQSDFGLIDIDAQEVTGVNNGGAAIFNPAIRGTLLSNVEPCIVLALEAGLILVVDTNGKLRWEQAAAVQLDWRYDFKEEKWVDPAGESLEEG